jgi:hypothetical protein
LHRFERLDDFGNQACRRCQHQGGCFGILRVPAEYVQRVVIESFEPKNQEMPQSLGVLDDV